MVAILILLLATTVPLLAQVSFVPSLMGTWEPRNIATKAGLVVSYDPGNTATETFNPAGYAAGSGVSWLSNRVSGVQSDLQQGTAANQPKISRTDNIGNLILQSEKFSTGWTVIRISAFGSGSVADADTAPDGTVTADFIQESVSANDTHRIQQSVSITAGSWKAYAWAKPNGRNWYVLHIGATGADFVECYFDAQNGVVGNAINNGIGSGAAGSIVAGPVNGYYLCRLSGSFSSTVTSAIFAIWLAEANGDMTFVGDGTSGLYIWGAVFTKADWTPVTSYNLAGGYQVTTSTSIFPGLGGRSVLYFDGSAYRMQTAAFTLKQPAELYKLALPWTWTLNDVGCDGYTNQTLRITQSATTPKIRMDAGTAATEFTPPPLGSWRVISAVFDGASSRMSTNSGAFVVSDAGTGNAGGFTLGSASTAGTTYWNGLVARTLICSKTNDVAEANYLRWGLLKQAGLY